VSVWYLDSSAIVKFAVSERESDALTAWRESLGSNDVLMTCELAVTEVIRAVRRVNAAVDAALAHLDALEQLLIDRELLLAAGRLEPAGLRTLDAVHLAAATAAGDELAGLVTYDERMAGAAHQLGVAVLAPGA